MFRVKICGVTRPDDARLACDAGADAIGLNFYPQSKRFLSEEQATVVAAAVTLGVAKVGVFVNAPAIDIRQAHQKYSLAYLQLHGDEPPELVAELKDLPLIRAFRTSAKWLQETLDYLDRCKRLGVALQAILIDAYSPGDYGGTGQTVDWTFVQQLRIYTGELPIILAGGLTPGNVARAISAARPDAVDTASGVESSPGVKDESHVREFVQQAKAAFGVESRFAFE